MEYPEVGRIEVEEKAVLPEKSEIPQTGEPVLGVIFEHISSSYGLQIMYELEQQARKAGYHLYPCFPTETGNWRHRQSAIYAVSVRRECL